MKRPLVQERTSISTDGQVLFSLNSFIEHISVLNKLHPEKPFSMMCITCRTRYTYVLYTPDIWKIILAMQTDADNFHILPLPIGYSANC